MKLALLLVVVAACDASGGVGSGDDYPIGPGGRTPGNSGRGSDAGVSDGAVGDGGVPQIRGRVCLLKDMRRAGDVTACEPMGAKGLNVTFGSAQTLTSAEDGSFSIDARMESNLVWRADSGDDETIFPSVFPSGNGAIIPAMDFDAYNNLLSTNGVVPIDQQGSVVLQVRTGTVRTANVTATSTGDSENPVQYDTTSLLDWDEDATAMAGIVWMPGVQLNVLPPTVARISLFLNGATTNQSVDAPIENGAITFVVKNLQ